MGHRKPDHAIFAACLEKTGAQPEDCILVDDRWRNLHAASELGFRTIHFMREDSDAGFNPDAVVCTFEELPDAVSSVFAQPGKKHHAT